MIELRDVRKAFAVPGASSVVALDGVTLEIFEGETLCIIGTSGSGKTTALKMINRLVEPTSGTILVDGADVRDVDVIALRRNIGYVTQKGGLFPHMTVERNVGLLCELSGWDESRRVRQVERLLGMVNLDAREHGDRHPRDLSGGQRQRVGVARALALDPPIVLLDEPFGALDPITRRQLHGEFKALASELEKTMVLVTHDLAEAFELGDRVVLMDAGRVCQIGNEGDFRNHPSDDFVRDFVSSHLGE